MFEKDLVERQSKIDWLLVLSLVGLMGLGAAFVFSATTVSETARELPWYRQHYFVMQLAWYAIGIIAAVAVCLVDYQILARWSLVAYWFSIVLLVFVFIAGTWRFGAKRWIDFGTGSECRRRRNQPGGHIRARARCQCRQTAALQHWSSHPPAGR